MVWLCDAKRISNVWVVCETGPQEMGSQPYHMRQKGAYEFQPCSMTFQRDIPDDRKGIPYCHVKWSCDHIVCL